MPIRSCVSCIYYDHYNSLCFNAHTCVDGKDSCTYVHDSLRAKMIDKQCVEVVDAESEFSKMCKRIKKKYKKE